MSSMDSIRSWQDSASDYTKKNPKTTRNILIGCGVAVAIVIAVMIYKRHASSSEGYAAISDTNKTVDK